MNDDIKVYNLKCANCGSGLEVGDDMDQFACGYCGTILMVQKRGGTIALKRIAEAVTQVQEATNKTAAELALKRLIQSLAEKEAIYSSLDETTLAEVERLKSSTFFIGGLLFFIAVPLAVVALSNWSKNASIALFFLLLSIGLLAGTCFIVQHNRKAAREAESDRESRLSALSKEIKEIKRKIESNKAIVDA